MPYSYKNSKGQTYYLHGKEVTLQGGRKQKIHYFAREAKDGDVMSALPAGHLVVENPRTGLPFLKRGEPETAPAKAAPKAKAAAAPKAKATAKK
jgi:hypothetical protein